MLHLARHREMVVRILRLVVGFCFVQSLDGLLPSLLSAGSLKLSWNANTEPDLAGYKVYYGQSSRNYGAPFNVGKVTEYTVNQLNEGVTYFFAVTAYDTAGNESSYSQEVSAPVPIVDRTAPSVTTVKIIDQSTVEIKFSEDVSKASAENKANYAIDNGISIVGAVLQADNRTVMLATSPHESGKTYKITIQKIADRAPTPNVMPHAVTFSYKFQVEDKTPPMVVNFRAMNQQTLEIDFSEAITVATAENKANYTINPAITVLSAKLQPDAKTVTLTTNTHATGVNYTLTIRGIADRAPTPNVMSQTATFNYSFQIVDNTPPAVANVHAVDQTTVEVLFTEPVTKNSAENTAYYTIDKGLVISSATLLADTRTVHLNTSPHTDGESYALTVRSIADRATPANLMPQPVTLSYLYQAEDRQPPEVNSVTLTDLTHLLIVFSEKVTRASAENKDNYRLSDGIQVDEARLAANGLEVTLLTSLHEYNKDYTISISNIQDISPAANTIAAGTILTYFLGNNSGGHFPGLTVNGLSPARYVLDSLQVGDTYYIDRPYVITQIPNSKRGLLWIKSASADRNNTSDRFLEFTLTREANVWIAYDSRANQAPNWLKDYFTRTNETIGVSESGVKLTLWKAHRLPGRVILGGNKALGVQNATNLSMYVVLIEDLQGPKPGDSPMPQRFALYQNYPNPFSISGAIPGQMARRTEIKYRLEERLHVMLTIHNMLGQAIRTLYNGTRPAGTHSVFWDGRDENGDPVPSGTYLCTLEIQDEVNNGDITLTTSLSRQTRAMTLLK